MQKMKNKRILLVNPSSRSMYEDAVVKDIVPYYPPLNLATIAGALLKEGHAARIIDFNLPSENKETLSRAVKDFGPDYLGITFTTPLFPQAGEICRIVRDIDPKITIVAGGVHSSAMPSETIDALPIDIIVIGEGDFALCDIIRHPLSKVKGICYRKNGKILFTPPRGLIENLDDLPYPAWHLFKIREYKGSSIVSRKKPVGFIETSRGCPFRCSYCNKSVFGYSFRAKSPGRVIEELKYMLRVGFREIYIVDDGFTTDMKRAADICDLIIKNRLEFPWTLTNGIRVDRTSPELFRKIRKAGCYMVAFGIESGNEVVLRDFGKAAKLEAVRHAVKWANKAGIETLGYFIIALPTDTEKTIRDTINFSKSLDLSLAKYGILTPYPGTPLYDQWDKLGYIKNKEWELYNVYHPSKIYTHPNLKWDAIYKYHRQAFRQFYFRPSFIFKRFLRDIMTGNLLNDIKAFFGTKW